MKYEFDALSHCKGRTQSHVKQEILLRSRELNKRNAKRLGGYGKYVLGHPLTQIAYNRWCSNRVSIFSASALKDCQYPENGFFYSGEYIRVATEIRNQWDIFLASIAIDKRILDDLERHLITMQYEDVNESIADRYGEYSL